MGGIKALVWDLAGVLLHTIRGNFNSMLAERLQAPLEEIERVMDSTENMFWDMAEISDDEFFGFILRELHLSAEKKAVLQRFVKDDFYVDQELLAYIRTLRQTYSSALLTNFPAHLHEFMRTVWRMDDAFDLIVASCDVKLIKPDPRIYQLTLERLDVLAHEAVFIDDREINIRAAEDLGIHAVLYINRKQTINEVENLLKTAS